MRVVRASRTEFITFPPFISSHKSDILSGLGERYEARGPGEMFEFVPSTEHSTPQVLPRELERI